MTFLRLAIVVMTFAGTTVAADTEIHRCLLEDGTTAFQETPCPEPAVKTDAGDEPGELPDDEAAAADDEVPDFVNPFDEAANAPTPSDPPLPEAALPEPVSGDRAECERTTRDAIDAIDLEMRQAAYTKEQGREYLEELLALTEKLRACKQL